MRPGPDGLQAFLRQLEAIVGRDVASVNFVFRCRCPDTGGHSPANLCYLACARTLPLHVALHAYRMHETDEGMPYRCPMLTA